MPFDGNENGRRLGPIWPTISIEPSSEYPADLSPLTESCMNDGTPTSPLTDVLQSVKDDSDVGLQARKHQRDDIIPKESSVDIKKYKRVKNSLVTVAQEYVCPITHELLLDPVTAEDGHLYERKAIVEYFNNHPLRRSRMRVPSPMTGKLMGKTLLTAYSARNAIQHLIESGAIDEDDVETWKHEKSILDTKNAARDGNPRAMVRLGEWFEAGINGFSQDDRISYYWVKKAADVFFPSGMAAAGSCLLHGHGTAQNISHGLVLTALAAEAGSASACYHLGLYFYQGKYGLPKDKAEARDWLEKVTQRTCGANDTNTVCKLRAKALGKELVNEHHTWDTPRERPDDEQVVLDNCNNDAIAKAMYFLGNWFDIGSHGLIEDKEQSHKWFTYAAECGDIRGICDAGFQLMSGTGVAQNISLGLVLISRAAVEGWGEACLCLCTYFYVGQYGLPRDTAAAVHWAGKIANGDYKGFIPQVWVQWCHTYVQNQSRFRR